MRWPTVYLTSDLQEYRWGVTYKDQECLKSAALLENLPQHGWHHGCLSFYGLSGQSLQPQQPFFFKCEEGTLKNISSSYSPGPNVYILMFMISFWSSCLNVEAKLKFWGKCDTIEDHLTTWLLNKITVEVSATGLWLLQTQSFNQVCSSRHWLPPMKLHKTNLEVVGYYMTIMLLFRQWTYLVQYVRNVKWRIHGWIKLLMCVLLQEACTTHPALCMLASSEKVFCSVWDWFLIVLQLKCAML